MRESVVGPGPEKVFVERGSGTYLQRVELRFEYPVCFTRDAFEPANRTLIDALARLEPTRRHRALFVIDDGVAAAWPELPTRIAAYAQAHAEQLEVLETQVVPGGERAKATPAIVTRCHADVHRLGIDRQSFIVAIGGGAMLDAVGYAAATAHRGVRLLRMPSTVLAQNDSGVGVKNGINAFGAKNFVGTFAPPFAVVNDYELLRTLDPRDLRAGMAEAVKVALVRDAKLFAWIEEHADAFARFDLDLLAEQTRRAAELHLQHIAQGGDPFELGSARPLDFGHWAAHKLESLTSHALRHGEAVAIGMALDCRYGVLEGLLPEATQLRIHALLERLGFTLWDDALDLRDPGGVPRVLEGLRDFREHLGGELTVTLLTDVGARREVHAIDHDRVLRARDWLRARHLERAARS